MSQAEIRLECLKLAHRHDRTPGEVLATAECYARWLMQPSADNRDERPADSPKEGKKLAPAKGRTSPSTAVPALNLKP